MTGSTLWAPWRIEYIRQPKGDGCVFCSALEKKADRENLVLLRGGRVFLIMNRYPYTAGHLLVVPNRHISQPDDLDVAESAEFWDLMIRAKTALDAALHPHGYNVGLNLGKAAGAGIGDHLHLHVVPRWTGDTNFLPTLGGVRVISQHLTDTYDSLVPHLKTVRRRETAPISSRE